jgi:gamma-glutamyltranspeptidase/glutathione hydrolase
MAADSISKRAAPLLQLVALLGSCLAVMLPSCPRAQTGPAQPVRARQHMVVAANPHAVAAGAEILDAGGSAVDAAITVQLVLSMVEPQSSGIGGGAFLMHFDAGESDDTAPAIMAYQGRERAPAAGHANMFLDENGRELPFPEVAWGGASVGVPGVMRMLERAHVDHGRLPWARLFEPAIELAERGFEISPRLYFLLNRFENFASARSFRAHYFDDDGKARAVGTRLVNAPYAQSLRALASNGADEMYEGRLAEAIVTAVNGSAVSRGLLTREDLRSYEAEVLAPLCSAYRAWTICGPQLPSSGGITLQQILGTAAHFELTRNDMPASVHIIAEASRLAFADRALYLGDPEFVDVPVQALLDPAYLAQRAALINPDRAIDSIAAGQPRRLAAWEYAPSPLSELASTSHFSIVDQWGDAVSMTTSVQSTFGSQLMVGGFLLNNQLTDFSEPRIDGRPLANRPDARKRPLSSMSPTIVLDQRNRIRLIVGSPGGTRIIGYVVQAIVGVLDLGLNVQAAVAAPHYLARFGAVELEERLGLEPLGQSLEALGHAVELRSLNSGLHAIAFEYDDQGTVTLLGGVDPRREGAALGK